MVSDLAGRQKNLLPTSQRYRKTFETNAKLTEATGIFKPDTKVTLGLYCHDGSHFSLVVIDHRGHSDHIYHLDSLDTYHDAEVAGRYVLGYVRRVWSDLHLFRGLHDKDDAEKLAKEHEGVTEAMTGVQFGKMPKISDALQSTLGTDHVGMIIWAPPVDGVGYEKAKIIGFDESPPADVDPDLQFRMAMLITKRGLSVDRWSYEVLERCRLMGRVPVAGAIDNHSTTSITATTTTAIGNTIPNTTVCDDAAAMSANLIYPKHLHFPSIWLNCPVPRQPDGVSCAFFAAAFAQELTKAAKLGVLDELLDTLRSPAGKLNWFHRRVPKKRRKDCAKLIQDFLKRHNVWDPADDSAISDTADSDEQFSYPKVRESSATINHGQKQAVINVEDDSSGCENKTASNLQRDVFFKHVSSRVDELIARLSTDKNTIVTIAGKERIRGGNGICVALGMGHAIDQWAAVPHFSVHDYDAFIEHLHGKLK